MKEWLISIPQVDSTWADLLLYLCAPSSKRINCGKMAYWRKKQQCSGLPPTF